MAHWIFAWLGRHALQLQLSVPHGIAALIADQRARRFYPKNIALAEHHVFLQGAIPENFMIETRSHPVNVGSCNGM